MKLFRFFNHLINTGLLSICVIAFLLGIYTMKDNAIIYEHATDQSLLKYKPSKEEKEVSVPTLQGNIGWITIDDTHIDYPIMQGKDNMEYLNKDPYGKYSLAGSIFLDTSNSADFKDNYNLIYGHHMNGKSMFGELDSFLNKAFFDAHKYGTLMAKDKCYAIEFVGILQIDAGNQNIFEVDSTDLEKVLQTLQEHAVINETKGTAEKLIALSTCRDTDSSIRTVLVGKLNLLQN